MKSDFFDKKLFIVFIVSLLFVALLGFLFNLFFIKDKVKNQQTAEAKIAQIQSYQTSDGLYDYYIFDIDNTRQVYIKDYNGSEKKAVIPASIDGIAVTKIDDGAFTNCHTLTSVVIPDGLLSIGICSFAGCNNLKSVIIPNSVSQIGYNCFLDCDGITICCSGDSAAENYAIDNNIKYKIVM